MEHPGIQCVGNVPVLSAAVLIQLDSFGSPYSPGINVVGESVRKRKVNDNVRRDSFPIDGPTLENTITDCGRNSNAVRIMKKPCRADIGHIDASQSVVLADEHHIGSYRAYVKEELLSAAGHLIINNYCRFLGPSWVNAACDCRRFEQLYKCGKRFSCRKSWN